LGLFGASVVEFEFGWRIQSLRQTAEFDPGSSSSVAVVRPSRKKVLRIWLIRIRWFLFTWSIDCWPPKREWSIQI